MAKNTGEEDGDVYVSMEITGRYENILSKLENHDRGNEHVRDLVTDVERILGTIEDIDGGTRSAIAKNLPSDMTVEYDAEAVVGVLQVLERYGLVVLEGNTWYPGEAQTGFDS